MEKTFTINVPDELWVNAWNNNKTETYTYNGPDTLYVLVSDRSDDVAIWSTEPINVDPNSKDFVIEINATDDQKIAVAHYINTHGSDHEYTYEDEANHDESIYKKITNPVLQDYFYITYDRLSGVVLEPIYKNTKTIAEEKAEKRLAYVKKYDTMYDFDAETQAVIDNFLFNMNTYIASMTTVYPWKYVTIDESEIPKVPALLTSTFSLLPDLDTGE